MTIIHGREVNVVDQRREQKVGNVEGRKIGGVVREWAKEHAERFAKR